jgi:hypothetical protein
MGIGSDNGKESAPAETPERQGSPGKLNVILHGLFAFDQEDEIVAYIPNLGSEHLYKAGSWLAETNLDEQADVRLAGVRPTTLKLEDRPTLESPESLKIKTDDNGETILGYKLDARHNIVLGNVPVSANATGCDCMSHSIQATLRFPYPPSPIQSLRRLKIPAVVLGGDDKNKVLNGEPAAETATVQVLTYDFDNDNDLKLGDHPWEPVIERDEKQNKNYVNLHVFSEPERLPTQDHLRHAFQAGVGLFVGVDLTLNGPTRPPDPDPPVPGVDEFELQDLVQRQRWLALLGRAVKEGRDAQAIWADPTPFSSSDSCAGCMASES